MRTKWVAPDKGATVGELMAVVMVDTTLLQTSKDETELVLRRMADKRGMEGKTNLALTDDGLLDHDDLRRMRAL